MLSRCPLGRLERLCGDGVVRRCGCARYGGPSSGVGCSRGRHCSADRPTRSPGHGEAGRGEHGQDGVSVPGLVLAGLVVVQAGFVRGGLDALFDRPVGSGHANQFGDRGAGRSGTAVESQLRVGVMGADLAAEDEDVASVPTPWAARLNRGPRWPSHPGAGRVRRTRRCGAARQQEQNRPHPRLH